MNLTIQEEQLAVAVFTPRNVNHILREIDDGNSMMTVKKQYIRLAGKPIHDETAQKLREWTEKVKTLV